MRAVIVLVCAALGIAAACYVPVPGKPLLPPRDVTLVYPDGHAVHTGVAVMLVSLENDPPLASRLLMSSDLVWNSWAPALSWGLDGAAGDDRQVLARSSAWFVSQRLLNGDVGVEVGGAGLPEGLRDGDVVLRAGRRPASVETLMGELARPWSWVPVAGSSRPRTLIEAMASAQRGGNRYAELTLRRDGQVSEVFVERQMASPTVVYREWTGQANPYIVPSLTSVSGESAGLGLSLGYLSALSGADFSAAGRVAATGLLYVKLDGSAVVEEIAGLPDKIEAAVAAGFPIIIVPLEQLDQADRVVSGRATLVGAGTVEGAVTALCRLGAACQGLPASLTSAPDGEFAVVPPAAG